MINGNLCPIPMFYSDEGKIDVNSISKFLEILHGDGCRNFYLAQSASEFEYLSREERLLVLAAVVGKLEDLGSCKLLSQPVGSGSTSELRDEAKMMADAGAMALVLKAPHLKDGARFISSKYQRAAYSPARHDAFFRDFYRDISDANVEYFIHDVPFSSGSGLSLALIQNLITEDKNLRGIKVHVTDKGEIQELYQTFGESLCMFDGFSKFDQIFSFIAGASARHSVWSWFCFRADQKFVTSLMDRNYGEAIKLVQIELDLHKHIREFGYSAYRFLCMQAIGLDESALISRIPGESARGLDLEGIAAAYKKYLLDLENLLG